MKLENSFGKWKKGTTPTIEFTAGKTSTKNTLYLINRPESQQSVIIAGHLTKKRSEVSQIVLDQMVSILGGDFTSRINMNLREDKHWAYGAGGLVLDAKEDRPFIVYAPVQTDKSAESITELRKELANFVTTKQATQAELDKVKTNQILKLPGQWETNNAVNSSLYDIVKYGLADNYYETYDANIRNISLKDLHKMSTDIVKPNDVNWFVVGDKEKIGKSLNKLGFDKIVEIDADGKPIKPVDKKIKKIKS